MTKKDQRTFIRSLLNSTRKALLAKSKYIPANWDGIELRQWIADAFAGETYFLQRKDNRRRLREYKNDIATRCGL